MKKMGVSFLAILATILIAIPLYTSPVQAVTPKQNAINTGLAWLAGQQATNGSWNHGFYPVASTAFAVLKFEEYANKTLHKDPFDPTYQYSKNVTAGWKYIFENAFKQAIGKQWNGTYDNDPDVCLPDGLGIGFRSPTSGQYYGDRVPYELPIVMMALEASWHPGFVVSDPLSPVNGWTYLNIMKDAVDYLSWAQNDYPNPGEGGWKYGPYDNGTLKYGAGGAPQSDNSVSQWAALGLLSASGWGINAPSWVKSDLLNHWLVHSQALSNGVYGGFGYEDNSSLNIARTAAGLIELTYCGVPTTDKRWAGARNWIATNWGEPVTYPEDGNIGQFYAMYGVMKAAITATPTNITYFGTHDWQQEYDNFLVANETMVNVNQGYWKPTGYGNSTLSTEWALLILEKVAPIPPPSPVGGVAVPVAGVAVPVAGVAVHVAGFALLTSYISLVSIFAVAAVATSICVKRVKRRKEKQ